MSLNQCLVLDQQMQLNPLLEAKATNAVCVSKAAKTTDVNAKRKVFSAIAIVTKAQLVKTKADLLYKIIFSFKKKSKAFSCIILEI